MITIKTEKGLIKVETWDDIISRAGFVKDLNPKDNNLETIIGSYKFKTEVRCGLSNCHTPHSKGYIVSTKVGAETNIGKDCGKTYFNVEFETLSRQFDRDVTEHENRESVWSFYFQIENFEIKLNHIRAANYGANWVNKNIKAFINRNRGCPYDIVKKLQNMVKTRSSRFTTQRIATEQEIEDLESIENRKIKRPHYVNDITAEISGLEALYPENDLRKLLVIDLETNIRELKTKDIDQMSFKDLQHWSKWIGTVDSIVDKALTAVESGKRFLNKENLKPLIHCLSDNDDIEEFRSLLRALEKQNYSSFETGNNKLFGSFNSKLQKSNTNAMSL